MKKIKESKSKILLEKSRIRETLNLSTDADHRTDIFWGGGMVKKEEEKKEKKNVLCVTCHMSHVTCHVSRVMCHVSRVTCHVSHFLNFFKIFFFNNPPPQKISVL